MAIISYVRFSACTGLVALVPAISNAQTIPAAVEPGRTETRFETSSAPRTVATKRRGLESTIPPAQAAKISLQIDGFNVVGGTAFETDVLIAIAEHHQGANASLLDVFQAAAALTSHYGDHGYLLSRVIVPPQELDPAGAIITLEVIEGYVDQVVLPENIGSRTALIQDQAQNIENARPLQADQLERSMLLANDIPGFLLRSNLSASPDTANASTLTLTASEDAGGWEVSVNNRGAEASGPLQITLSGEANNLLGWNEQISGGITLAGPSRGSAKPELAYVFMGYDQVLNADGLRFNLDANFSKGDPDDATLSALGYATEGQNLSASLSFPFIRTRSQNLTGTFGFDLKNSKSTNFAGIVSQDRLRILRGELSFDSTDRFNGTNLIAFAFHKGIEGLGSTASTNPNASRTPGEVDFRKATLALSRTQSFGNGFSLFAAAFGQWTDDPLLSSQECGFGGQQYGRGFDSSVITGDTCLKASLEVRYNLEASSLFGANYVQAYAFGDAGRIKNINPPLGTPSSDNASSAGFGLRFGLGEMNFDISATKPLDTPNSTSVSDNWQGWFSLSAQF